MFRDGPPCPRDRGRRDGPGRSSGASTDSRLTRRATSCAAPASPPAISSSTSAPGTACSPAALVDAGARVVAVELHPRRLDVLRDRFAGAPVTVVRADVAAVRLPGRPFRVVANPPWSMAETIRTSLLRAPAAGARRPRAAALARPPLGGRLGADRGRRVAAGRVVRAAGPDGQRGRRGPSPVARYGPPADDGRPAPAVRVRHAAARAGCAGRSSRRTPSTTGRRTSPGSSTTRGTAGPSPRSAPARCSCRARSSTLDQARADEALAVLDDVEATATDLLARIAVTTTDGAAGVGVPLRAPGAAHGAHRPLGGDGRALRRFARRRRG